MEEKFEIEKMNQRTTEIRQEELRLFYVAMTRAMEDLHIYTWEPVKSEFLEEIEDFTDELRLSY